MGEPIELTAPDGGGFTGYLARAEGAAPGVLVMQEIFGVNQVMRDVADGLAADGFTALVPDLFWRQEPGIDITDRTKEEWDKAFSLLQGFDQDQGIEDSKAALATLRGLDGATGKAGCVGYCLGGRLAYLMACRSDVDAAVGYYGIELDVSLDEARNLRHPLMLHIAAEDGFFPRERWTTVVEGLKDNALATTHVYEGCDHAFARPGGEHFDAEAARLANGRTRDFFNAHLA